MFPILLVLGLIVGTLAVVSIANKFPMQIGDDEY
jgi:hypothetical protein